MVWDGGAESRPHFLVPAQVAMLSWVNHLLVLEKPCPLQQLRSSSCCLDDKHWSARWFYTYGHPSLIHVPHWGLKDLCKTYSCHTISLFETFPHSLKIKSRFSCNDGETRLQNQIPFTQILLLLIPSYVALDSQMYLNFLIRQMEASDIYTQQNLAAP